MRPAVAALAAGLAAASGAWAQEDPHAHHRADHDMAVPAAPEPPAAPSQYAADSVHPPEAMARARAQLALEHGGGSAWSVRLDAAEARPDVSGYAWRGEAWAGGDLNRFVAKTEGEGEGGGDLHAAEVQALYSRAVGPYFDMQAGVRHDFEPGPSRTYAVVGLEGLAPYWFELSAAAFLSQKGEVSARLEASYDLRLIQSLVLEPRLEADLTAREAPELGLGRGLSEAEFGLRLRWHVKPEFAPYVGVVQTRKFGDTADFARTAGEATRENSWVIGVRAWL